MLTHRELDLGLHGFHYTPNACVFLFRMTALKLYFLANGYFVIIFWSSNGDHLLIYIVLVSQLKWDVVSLLFSPFHPPAIHSTLFSITLASFCGFIFHCGLSSFVSVFFFYQNFSAMSKGELLQYL